MSGSPHRRTLGTGVKNSTHTHHKAVSVSMPTQPHMGEAYTLHQLSAPSHIQPCSPRLHKEHLEGPSSTPLDQQGALAWLYKQISRGQIDRRKKTKTSRWKKQRGNEVYSPETVQREEALELGLDEGGG